MSELQVARLKEISKRPDIYEILTKSLAPNIWELDDVKKGLLCQVRHILVMHSLITYQFSEGANIYLAAAFWWQCIEISFWCQLPWWYKYSPCWWSWDKQVPATSIHTQTISTWHLHQWKGKLCSWTDCICSQGPRDRRNCMDH